MGDSKATFDGLILGAGHNALVLQAYLSRCGLKTLSLDRADIPGGGLMTLEHPRLSGFRYNPHSFFHRAITAAGAGIAPSVAGAVRAGAAAAGNLGAVPARVRHAPLRERHRPRRPA